LRFPLDRSTATDDRTTWTRWLDALKYVFVAALGSMIEWSTECRPLRGTALRGTALHCAALHCAARHCTALRGTALHCAALRCRFADRRLVLVLDAVDVLGTADAKYLKFVQSTAFLGTRPLDREISSCLADFAPPDIVPSFATASAREIAHLLAFACLCCMAEADRCRSDTIGSDYLSCFGLALPLVLCGHTLSSCIRLSTSALRR
jgi:hypothetical protein